MKTKLSTKAFESKYKLDIRTACSYRPTELFIKEWYEIDYEVKLSNGKNLQRDFVWTIEQKRSLIISMLKELQLPNFAIVIYKDDLSTKELKDQITIFKVIDGKQRLKSIEEFIKGQFSLLIDNEEYFFEDLDDNAKYRITCYSLNFNIIYEYPDLKLSDDQLISWFELVNFAGTQQDINHLENLKS